MADAASFVGSIPENYDRYLGPLFFFPYADDLVARVAKIGPARVLETACGTGIVTKRLRQQLGKSARLVATDLNEPMMATAKKTVGEGGAVEWRQADMTKLPFADGEFDALVCQFGLMFVPDKLAAAREAKRVLARGGALFLNTWSGLAKNELPRLVDETVRSLFPADPPQFFQVPFSYGDPLALRALFEEAGFTNVSTEIVAKQGNATSARDAATGCVEGSPLLNAIVERGARVADVVAALERALIATYGERALRTPLEAVVTTATA